jgi:hypothetical protein
VEIVSEYPREHVVAVVGGTLSTVDTQIGGTAKAGVFTQTIFALESDGKGKFLPKWTMSDTLVEYSYGILHTAGTLEAWNIQQGPSPDAIIIGSAATAVLHGGTFNIALRAGARTGTDSVLDLPSSRPVTGVYRGEESPDSGRRIPAMTSRIKLEGTTVPMWFLFVNNVTTTPSPRTTLRFRDVQSIIPAIHAVDFNGEMTLRTTWVDDSPKWNLTLPRDGFDGGQSGCPDRDGMGLPFRVGLSTWSGHRPVTPCAIIRGPTAIAELFTYEGTRAEVIGTPRLGRYYNTGDASEHEVRLYKADGLLLGRVSLHASRDTDYLGFNYASLREMITLEPDAEYILVSSEDRHDRFADDSTTVTPQAAHLSVVGAVSSIDGVNFQPGQRATVMVP